MTTTTLLPAAPATAPYSRDTRSGRLGAGHQSPAFRPRVGIVKRSIYLLKSMGPRTALRSGASLLYARLTTKRRVRGFHAWSRTLLAGAAAPGKQDIARPREDLESLLARVTSGVSREVRTDIVSTVVRRYCRTAGDAELAGLRKLVSAGPYPGASEQTYAAWHIVCDVLDATLSRRHVAKPLRELCVGLAAGPGPGLDATLIRLSVGLQSAGGDADGKLLEHSLNSLSDVDLRQLAAQTSTRPDEAGRHAAARLCKALVSADDPSPRGTLRVRMLSTLDTSVRRVLLRRLDAGLRQSTGPIDAALREGVARGDRMSVARGLVALSEAVRNDDALRQAHGLDMSPGLARQVRSIVSDAMTVFRGPGNPRGRLSKVSLAGLPDEVMLLVRRAETALAPYGVAFEKQALDAVAVERSAPFRAGVSEIAAGLARVLGQDSSGAAFVAKLQDCARATLRLSERLRPFAHLGDDGLAALGRQTMAEVVGHMDANETRKAKENFERYGASLSKALDEIGMELAGHIVDDDPDIAVSPERQTVFMLRTASMLAGELGDQIAVSLAQKKYDVFSLASFVSPLDEVLRREVGRQFCIDGPDRPDGQQGGVALRMSPEQYAFMEKELREPLPIKRLVPWTIAQGGLERPFIVAGQFKLDAPRGGSFSVSGVSHDGHYVPYTSAAQRDGEQSRLPGLARGLLALERLAGDEMPALTAYATQTSFAPFYKAMGLLPTVLPGHASPVRLADGTPVILGGGGKTHVDYERLMDGSYRMRCTARLDKVLCAIPPHDPDASVPLDEDASTIEFSYAVRLRIGADGGQSLDLVEPPTWAYRIVGENGGPL